MIRPKYRLTLNFIKIRSLAWVIERFIDDRQTFSSKTRFCSEEVKTDFSIMENSFLTDPLYYVYVSKIVDSGLLCKITCTVLVQLCCYDYLEEDVSYIIRKVKVNSLGHNKWQVIHATKIGRIARPSFEVAITYIPESVGGEEGIKNQTTQSNRFDPYNVSIQSIKVELKIRLRLVI